MSARSHLATASTVAVLAFTAVAACQGAAPAPPVQPVVLELVRRDPTGALVGVAGIPVHRNDVTSGAFVETRATDAAGRVDFGVQPGPVTLSAVVTAGGTVRAYTLLGLPGGTTRLRYDRLPGDPGTVLSTVDVALAPPLGPLQRARVCLPTGCQGLARPGAASVNAIVLTDRDLQVDGKLSLYEEVDDDEMGTAVDCRLTRELAVPAPASLVPGAAGVAPGASPALGNMMPTSLVVLRKDVAFATRPGGSCASAFTDADGFSLQGEASTGGSLRQGANYFEERRSAVRRGALWTSNPSFDFSVARTIPSSDVAIEDVAHAGGTLRVTLKGTEVRSLVAARGSLRWSVGGNPVGSGWAREWYLYGGLEVTPAACDGTLANPACTVELKLPALAAMGVPPDQADGGLIEVEAVAPAGAMRAADFWDRLAARGDADSLLARGFTGASFRLDVWKLSFLLDVSPFVLPGYYPLGKVTATGGIACSQLTGPCQATYPGGTSVTLTAIPNSGAEFVGWLGCPAGTPATATVTFPLTADTYCTPQFRSIPGQPSSALNVAVISPGNGLITSDDGWIRCGTDTNHVPQTACTFNYGSGTLVVLRGSPTDALNPYVPVWSGDCAAATGLMATVVMDAPRSCGLEFKPKI